MILTQVAVSEALENALAEGYALDKWTDFAIAYDLVSYNSDYEDVNPDQLIPFIQEWKRNRR